MRRILLVEPGYKNKYPPMGLMKISRYHKILGDEVTFVKGIERKVEAESWDRIYVTTLFTFDFDITVATINHYKMLVDDIRNIYVGGIMSSLMPDKVIAATGLEKRNILIGLFTDTSVVGDDNGINIDTLPLDYDILEQIPYKYPAGDNYFAYTSRGCPNHCKFCAVPILEPQFCVTNNIVQQIKAIDDEFGPKQHLLMLDNNILNAPNLEEIVDSLCEAGFYRGAKFNHPGDYNIVMMRYHKGVRADFLDRRLQKYLSDFKKRIKAHDTLETFLRITIEAEEADNYAEYMLAHEEELRPIVEKYRSKSLANRYIDFNQGVDGRKINDKTMAQLARLAIRPLRIAFDDIALKEVYVRAVRKAYEYGVKELSNYMLFNFNDKPEDLYQRLEVNIKLNEELGIQIFSFPMRYAPVNLTDRSYIGKHWNTKYLRAISAILHVTKGVVAAGSEFFYKAFGKDVKEFYEILSMPRDMIMYRKHYEDTGETEKWKNLFNQYSETEKKELMGIVSNSISEMKEMSIPNKFYEIIPFYFLKFNGNKSKDKAQNTHQISFSDLLDLDDYPDIQDN